LVRSLTDRAPRDLIVVSLALFTWGIGEGLFFYFQPLYLQEWGANPVEIGAILSMVGIAMAVSQIPAGYLSDRIGALPVMQSAWVLGFLAAVLMALAGSLQVFIVGLLLYSTTTFVSAPMNSYIANMRGKWRVERAVTTTGAAFHLGMVIGPLLGGWVGQQIGLQMIYRFAAAIFLFSTLIIFLARRAVFEEQVELPGPQHSLIANPRFLGLLAVIFFTMFALYLPQPLTPLYLKEQQAFSVQDIGLLGAIGSMGNVVILLALGRLSAPLGMLAGQAMVGLFALVLWLGTNPLLLFAGYFFAGGYRLFRSMALAYTRSTVRASETGLAFGLVETGSAISVILAPLAAGFLYQRDPQSIYIAGLAATGAMLLLNALRLHASQREENRQRLEAGLQPVDEAIQDHPSQAD
jgi:MFS family permease